MKLNKITISRQVLRSNISTIRQKIKGKKICAVVKADAYGLGCKHIVPIIDPLVDYYAVANIDEAVMLRRLGTDKSILVLGTTPYSDFSIAQKYNIKLSLSSLNYIQNATNYITNATKNIQNATNCDNLAFHLQVNTGLNRFGVSPQDVDDVVRFAKSNHINIVGAYTHFATTSDDEEYIDTQYNLFEKATRNMNKSILKHCSNTYASLHKACQCEDMVRVGFGLYGSDECGLQPIVSITAKVLNIIQLESGESLGYDRTFVATKSTKVAVVSMGYADGLSRALSDNFALYIKGKFVPIIGLICMDVCFVDVSDVDANLFDDVEILGEHITLKNYAHALHTSPYEILLNFSHARADTIIDR